MRNINEAERLACEKVGCKYAVALSAGTAALHMSVKLAGREAGRESILFGYDIRRYSKPGCV